MRILFVLVMTMTAGAQAAKDANQRYQTPEGRATIGGNLGGHDREARQQPRELIAALGIGKGETVCDLGTGVGFMLPYLSQAVGAQGRLVAEDIFPDFLNQAKERAAKAKLSGVTFVLGTDRDPRLPARTCDLVLVLDAYHHFDYPAEMLGHIKQSLTAKGRLAIVDYYKRPGAMGPATDAVRHIRLDMNAVVAEVEQQGYRAGKRGEHLKQSQYFVLFTAR